MRVLFVALSASITAARWIDQLADTGWDLHLFPSEPADRHCGALRGLTLHHAGLWRPLGLDASVRVAGLWPLRRGAYRAQQILEKHTRWRRDRARCLARTVRAVRPDIVHTLEMQRAGYLMLDACRHLRRRPLWIYSCWGSDLYHFGAQEEHRSRIRSVLERCDGLMADCNRDVELAAALGFRGKVLGVFPGSGGIDAAAAQTCRFPGPVCRRPAIAVKGYQNDTWGGRALVALQGIHRAADVLRRFQIHVYSATPDVARVVEHIRVTSSLDIRCLPAISHAEMLALFGRSRLAIATGTTDGTPNAMLEAMAMGACPVQSDTGSTAEWIEDGVNGRLVPPEDALAIEAAVRHAATDDAFVERAATLNLWRIRDRADRAALRPRIVDAYLRAAGANHV